MIRATNSVILIADDYAMSEGVTRGIEDLASAERLSGASALVTLPTWPRYAARLGQLRSRIAIGLHVNLTLGSPLGPMPYFAPFGIFPTIRDILIKRFRNRTARDEIALEVLRQIDSFEEGVGYSPDFIDGHQHVHVLPAVREGFLRALSTKFPDGGVFVRDPSDALFSILVRGGPRTKALSLAFLARGFGAAIRSEGFITNSGFSGVSTFAAASSINIADEFQRFFHHVGPAHLIMCHPGYPDAELQQLDAVVARRGEEFAFLSSAPDLPEVIWHSQIRDALGRPIWPKA